MQLPNLEAKAGRAKEDEWTREGWDRRGARSRLDRRRSMKESIKRRGMQSAIGQDSPSFTDEDLRYRQLTKREQPAMQAVVILLLDVSGSMGERERQISKTFFFWAIQGLRRQYRHLELVFVAHTSEAWEFRRRVLPRHRHGGTVASRPEESTRDRRRALQPSQYKVYLFYPPTARTSLRTSRRRRALEDWSATATSPASEVARMPRRTRQRESDGCSSNRARRGQRRAYRVSGTDDIWNAVRHFFGRASEVSP